MATRVRAAGAFADRDHPPDEPALAKALGNSAAAALRSIREQVARDCAPIEEEWAFAGAKFGWSLRLRRAKRVVVYLLPCEGRAMASFALGEKACAAAGAESLPAEILGIIERAPRYAEGRGVRIPVRTVKDAKWVCRLAARKIAS